MKINKISALFIIGLLMSIVSSCEMIIDNDTTGGISAVSTKPTVVLLGEPIMSIQQGETYTDAGVGAEAGDNAVNVEIISGEVNPNEIGFYVVTYRAENEYGWQTYAYRSVLVHDGTPYNNETIEGRYKVGFSFKETVEKHSVFGYWSMSNFMPKTGAEFPILFAEQPDGTLTVVPDEHPTYGRYTGYGKFESNKLTFTLNISPRDSEPYSTSFIWSKY